MQEKSDFLVLSIVAIVAVVSLVVLTSSAGMRESFPHENPTMIDKDLVGQGGEIADNFIPGEYFSAKFEEDGRSYCVTLKRSESEKRNKEGCIELKNILKITVECYENDKLVLTETLETVSVLCSPNGCGKVIEVEDQGQTYEGPLRSSSSTTISQQVPGSSSSTSTSTASNQIMDSSSGSWVGESGVVPQVEFNSCF